MPFAISRYVPIPLLPYELCHQVVFCFAQYKKEFSAAFFHFFMRCFIFCFSVGSVVPLRAPTSLQLIVFSLFSQVKQDLF